MAANACRQLEDVSQALHDQLSSLSVQLERLQQCSSVLSSRHQQARPQDRGTQADGGRTMNNPLRYVKAPPDTTRPFAFRAPSRSINWRALRSVNPQALLAANDTEVAMQLPEEVTCADLTQGSIYERSEANLLKLLQVAQLQLQYLQYKLQQKAQAEQVLEGDVLALAAGLASLAPPSLGDLSAGLGGIGAGLQQLGCARVGGLVSQVRAEERAAAQAALEAAISRTKQNEDDRAARRPPQADEA